MWISAIEQDIAKQGEQNGKSGKMEGKKSRDSSIILTRILSVRRSGLAASEWDDVIPRSSLTRSSADKLSPPPRTHPYYALRVNTHYGNADEFTSSPIRDYQSN